MDIKKKISVFELLLLVVSFFAFTYIIAESTPSIPLVSAERATISQCCENTKLGAICQDVFNAEDCVEGSNLVPSRCEDTSFCKLGCCIDEVEGTFDKKVPQMLCVGDNSRWEDDENCNVVGVNLGCCFLGDETSYVTSQRCSRLADLRGFGKDWRDGIDEASCVALSDLIVEGACVLENNYCKYGSQQECISLTGSSQTFFPGYLCTASVLNTTCKKTEKTSCIAGKDEVYFMDSCGNPANIYDSTRYDDDEIYWEYSVLRGNSCFPASGNENSETCGSCNRFLGGYCDSASQNNFDVEMGDFYCKPTSCMYKGEKYENGESWCIYDGKIGDGDDVVGSRHWRYVCNYGEIQIEPCADARNEICVQETMAGDLESATCKANNWRECINTKKDCESVVDCETRTVVFDKFNVKLCTPKYPEGFGFDEENQRTAQQICGQASKTCIVKYKKACAFCPCKCDENCACEDAIFTQSMNDLCTALGDCGGYVNVLGEKTSGGYSVTEAPKVTFDYSDMANPDAHPNQKGEVGNISDMLEQTGMLDGGGDNTKGLGGVTMNRVYNELANAVEEIDPSLAGPENTPNYTTSPISGQVVGGGITGEVVGPTSPWQTALDNIAIDKAAKMAYAQGWINAYKLTHTEIVPTIQEIPMAQPYSLESLSSNMVQSPSGTMVGQMGHIDALPANADLLSGAGTPVKLISPGATTVQSVPAMGGEIVLGSGTIIDVGPPFSMPWTVDGISNLGPLAGTGPQLSWNTLSGSVGMGEFGSATWMGSGTVTGASGVVGAGTAISGAGPLAGTGPQLSWNTLGGSTGIEGVGGGANSWGVGAAPKSVMTPMVQFAGFVGGIVGGFLGGQLGNIIVKALGMGGTGAMLMSMGMGMLGSVAGTVVASGIASALGGGSFAAGASAAWGATPLAIPILPIIVVVAVVMIIVSLFMGADCPPVIVSFTCSPWQQPAGGADCEKCNDDPLKPCSEYRCHSLGAACELINRGTEQEMCIAGGTNDGKAPDVEPMTNLISDGKKYSNVSGEGFSITNIEGGCLNAYEIMYFGISTNEPSRCKFDMTIKDFEDMSFNFGGTSYTYNHTTPFVLPDPAHGQSQGANWSGKMTLYAKCEDRWGNIMPSYYTMDMCVNQADDITAPRVNAAYPIDDWLVRYNATSVDAMFFTNEPADCRWSLSDKDYDQMENDMSCKNDLIEMEAQGYLCNTTLPIENATSEFYIKCADQPWLEANESEKRAVMQESFVYNLKKPEAPLSIVKIAPTEEKVVDSIPTTIDLRVETAGGAPMPECLYSFKGHTNNMIQFYETVDRYHKQPLILGAGTHKVYIRCRDDTGDVVENQTTFKISYDSTPPRIARIWQEGRSLKLITTENSECSYTNDGCLYDFAKGESAGSGTEHRITVVKGDTYYIKCKDQFENVPSGCSVIIRAL